MKNFKRLLALLLAVIMTVGTVATISAASITFTDTKGHWAWDGGYIPYLVEKDVLNGYNENGQYVFKPDKEVKRCEFIKMLDETFGLTETKAVNFTDVKSTDWFCVYFQKAAAQGYLLNYGTSCDPEGKLTRDEAISLLVRYLNLDPEKKADASTFADFNTIESKYQDYVLEAIDAGLIEGYKQNNGTYLFKPKNTLTRAEALTILYRAAGCIYNKNSFVRDEGAAAKNSVITKSNITIEDQILTGRTIVSEGAAEGIVVFSNCTIADTLYIRGNAKVYLDKCNVENVVVTGNGGVALFNSANVENLTLSDKATVNLQQDTKIGTLNVEAVANNASVTGSGKIDKIVVKANGFSSSIMPEDFELAKNITAKFAGKEYTGSKSDTLIYDVEPYVAADKTHFYVEFTPAKSGSLYYYYADKNEKPTAKEFDETYNSTATKYKGRVQVVAHEPVSKKTYTLAELKDYGYVVIMFQAGMEKETPIVIANAVADTTGFSTEPTLSAAKDKITLKTAVKGTVYYYYTDTCDALTPQNVQNNYKKTEEALKGKVSVSAKENVTINLKSAYVASFDYVIVYFTADNGTMYIPVALTIADTGFAEVPAVKSVGSISYKSKVTGMLCYYYSKTETVPTADEFKTLWTNSSSLVSGNVNVTANGSGTIRYNTSYTSTYPYMILALKQTNSNTYMLPVCVSLGVETGFKILPRMTNNNTIGFESNVDGTIKYYFTTSSEAPTIEAFSILYNSKINEGFQGSVGMVYTYFPMIQVSDDVKARFTYCVLMLIDKENNSYEPIVVSLTYDPNDTLTGFVSQPYVRDGLLYLKTTKDTTVRYYYTDTSKAVSATEFYTNYINAKAHTGLTLAGELRTAKGESVTLPITSDSYIRYLYGFIAIAVWDGTQYSEPIVLDAFTNTPSVGNTAGFTYNKLADLNDYIIVVPYYTGKLYYFLTDSITEANATFNKTTALSVDVVSGKNTPIATNSKKYVVACLEAGGITYDKVIIEATTGSQYQQTTFNDGANVSTKNMTVIPFASDHYVRYQPQTDCYVYYSLVGDNELVPISGTNPGLKRGNLGNAEVAAGEWVTYDYTTWYNLAQTYAQYEHVYLYIQCVATNGSSFYASEVITLK